MGKLIEVAVPDIGDFTDVPVIELLVADGDTVDKDQALIVLESDKSTMEVPAPAAGVVRGLKVKVGGKVSRGDAICELETASSGAGGEARGDGTSGPEKPAAAMPAAAASADPAPKGESPHESDGGTPDAAPLSTSGTVAHAGPATRKFARELGVDLSRVKGSGPKGRVVIEDVQQHVKAQMTGPGSTASGRARPTRSVARDATASAMPDSVRKPPVTINGTSTRLRTFSANSRKYASRFLVLARWFLPLESGSFRSKLIMRGCS